jgi:hypothetical protein
MPPVKEVTELRSRGTTTTAPHTDVFQATGTPQPMRLLRGRLSGAEQETTSSAQEGK